jgi:hypothetical protein
MKQFDCVLKEREREREWQKVCQKTAKRIYKQGALYRAFHNL